MPKYRVSGLQSESWKWNSGGSPITFSFAPLQELDSAWPLVSFGEFLANVGFTLSCPENPCIEYRAIQAALATEASIVKEAWSRWRHFACHNQLSWSQVYCIRCIWSRWLSIRLFYQSCSTLAERVHQNSSTIKLGTEINASAFAQILHHLSCCTPYSNLYSIDGLVTLCLEWDEVRLCFWFFYF